MPSTVKSVRIPWAVSQNLQQGEKSKLRAVRLPLDLDRELLRLVEANGTGISTEVRKALVAHIALHA